MSKINKISVDGVTYDIEDKSVPSWAKGVDKPTYKTSELENDNNFVTETQMNERISNIEISGGVDLSNYATKEELPTKTSQLENDSGYIKNTDYASSDNAGLIKTESYYGLHTSSRNGSLYCEQFSYDEYTNNKDENCFISKGTLENVIVGKGLNGASGEIIYANYDSEIIIGYLVENGVNIPVYRKIFKGQKVANSNLVFDTSALNIDKVLNIQGSTDRSSWVYPLMRYETSDNYTYAYYTPNDNKLIFTSGTSSWCSTGNVTIILEYTKKTN